MVDHVADGLLRVVEEIRAVRGRHEVATGVRDGQFLPGGGGETQFRNVGALVKIEAEGDGHGRLDTCAVNLPISLRGVAIAAREECAGNEDRELHNTAG